MSAHKWEWEDVDRDRRSSWIYTGRNRDIQAQVYPITCSTFWAFEAMCFHRKVKETGLASQAEAKALAERWLDEREAETKTTKGGGAA